MPFSLLWLPQILRDAGLTVNEVPGWQNRGHGDEGKVLGILCHHTCGPLHGDLPDLNVLVDGRPDLGGPLCNLGLGRSGQYWMIAAGKGWHAGAGNWQGVTDGNAHLIGIEAENTGEKTGARADIWPEVQMSAYMHGCAAILKHIGAKPIMCAGHKEYARPKGRKDDPDFDMDKFRADVAAIMDGTHITPLPPRPTMVEAPPPPNSPPLVRPGSIGADVQRMQTLLGCKVTGEYIAGSETEWALRLFQTRHGLIADARCGAATWAALLATTTT